MQNATMLHRANHTAKANRGYITLAMTFVAMASMLAFPELAHAQDILDEKAATAMAWIQRAVYFILTVAVMGSGVLAAFGRMSWSTVGQVLVGAIVAGLATAVVDALYDGG